jgi:hypothetical protein
LFKAGTGYMNKMGTDFPRDVTVIDSVVRLMNETFEKAIVEDGLYNHHVVFYDQSKPAPQKWLACNGKEIPEMPMAIVMGAGSEDPDREYSAKSTDTIKTGFYIGKNDVITNMIDIVNYQERERTVYTVNELEYLPGKPEGYVHAQSRSKCTLLNERWLRGANQNVPVIPMGVCDGMGSLMNANSIHPTKGNTKFVLTGKNDVEITKDGYLVGTYGHLHDGGLKMVVTINGKEACTSSIVYGGAGHEQVQADGKIWKTIGKTIGCVGPIRVSKGDKLSESKQKVNRNNN